MVTAYTAALFTLLLVNCLIGIAARFHMAYTAADTDGPADRKPLGFFRRPSERKYKLKKPRKNGKELNSKIHKQEGEFFFEFRCYEASQDHGEAVAKAWAVRMIPTAASPTILKNKTPGCSSLSDGSLVLYFHLLLAIALHKKHGWQHGRNSSIMVEWK